MAWYVVRQQSLVVGSTCPQFMSAKPKGEEERVKAGELKLQFAHARFLTAHLSFKTLPPGMSRSDASSRGCGSVNLM